MQSDPASHLHPPPSFADAVSCAEPSAPIPNTSWRLLFSFSSQRKKKKTGKVSLWRALRLHTFSRSPDDITELQCCTLRERCQSPPSDANSLSAGHLALLRSRHHSVTTYPLRSGCSYADGRRSARRRATHLLLRASPAGHRVPTGGRHLVVFLVEAAAGQTESRVKTNCSHGDAYTSGGERRYRCMGGIPSLRRTRGNLLQQMVTVTADAQLGCSAEIAGKLVSMESFRPW